MWNTWEVSKSLNASWDIFTHATTRTRDDASELFYHEYRQGVRWKADEHLLLGVNYLFVRDESSGKPLEEHRGELDMTPRTTVGDLKLSLRGRMALRTIQGSAGEEEWRFRLKPLVAYPLNITGRAVMASLGTDVFYDDTKHAWNQNRLSIGMGLPVGRVIGSQVNVGLYYMLQHKRSSAGDWGSNHVLGSKLSIKY